MLIQGNVSDPEPQTKRAWALLEMKRWREAIQESMKALAIAPNYRSALHALTWAQIQTNELNDAEHSARIIISNEPRIGLGYYLLAHIFSKQNKFQDALSELQTALGFNPNEINYHIQKAFVLRSLYRYEEALEESKAALQLDPNNLPAIINLGFTLHNLQRFSEAEQVYFRGLTIEPNHPELRVNLTNLLTRQSEKMNVQEAEKSARDLIREFPNLGLSHHFLAMVLHKQYRHQEALESSKEAARVEKNAPYFMAHLACYQCQMRQHEEAILSARQAMEQEPTLADTHINLACNLRHLCRYEEAEAVYRNSLNFALNKDSAKYSLARFLARFKDAEAKVEAEQIALKMIQESPNQARGYALLAYVQFQQKRFSESITTIHEAIRLRPEVSEYYTSLANSFLETRQFEETINAAKQAISRQSNSIRAYNIYSLALEWMGLDDEAETIAQKALPDGVEDTELFALRGKHKLRLGKYEESVFWLEKAIELDRSDLQYYHYLDKARQHLQESTA